MKNTTPATMSHDIARLASSTLRNILLCFFAAGIFGSSVFATVDYTVFSVSMSKNKVAPGDPIIATVVIKNVGTTAATKQSVTDIRFLSQSARPIPIDGKIGHITINPLAANQSVETQIAFYTPSVADGVFFIWAVADNTNVLGQTANAVDNDYGHSAAITVAKATAPITTPTTTTPVATTPSTNTTTPSTGTNTSTTPTTTAPPATTATTTPPIAGNTIVLSSGSATYAWSTNIYSYTTNVPQSGAIDEKIRLGGWGDSYQGYLKFDLTGITSPVQAAKLRLFVLPDENQTTPVRVMRITSAWSPANAVAWSGRPSMVDFVQISAPSWQSWVEIDITALVNGWVRGDFPNYGIGFVPTRNDHSFTTFASPGNSDASKRPQLMITGAAPTTTAPPATSTSSMSQPNFTSRFYTTENIFWQAGFAPNSTNPPNSKLGGAAGNCTWYAHGRTRELGQNASQLNAMSGNASTWDDSARALGIRVDMTPVVGAIAQSDQQNHVAIVESVNSDGTITVSESSYVTDLTSSWNFLWRTRTTTPGWFSAFIHVTKASTTRAPTNSSNNSTSGSTTSTPTSATNPTPTTVPSGGTGTNTTGTGTTNGGTNNTSSNNSGTSNTTNTTGGSAANPTSSSTAVIATLGNQTVVAAPRSKIVSISTLSVTPLVSGFNISGDAPKRLVVRAVGPTLAQFGVSGVLADPQVRVFDNAGHQVAANDDWDGSSELRSTFTSVGLFGLPSGSKDAAMIVTLQPGVYTAQVATKGTATGLAILEIYELP